MKKNKKINVLQFIELYKSHEELWNVNLREYRRNDLKLKAYKSIAAEMKMTWEDVRKKIKSIRTAYSAEKAKIEKGQKCGWGTESTYIPTVFWYNEMAFLDAYLKRRPAEDTTNQVENDEYTETSFQPEETEIYLEPPCISICTEQPKPVIPTCSKKRKYSQIVRKCSPEPTLKLDDSEKVFFKNKDTVVFEAFGENVGRQIKEFPEEEAYQLMADIQVLLSKKKMEFLKKYRDKNAKTISVEVLKPIKNYDSRASTPNSQISNTSRDFLRYSISDSDILEIKVSRH